MTTACSQLPGRDEGSRILLAAFERQGLNPNHESLRMVINWLCSTHQGRTVTGEELAELIRSVLMAEFRGGRISESELTNLFFHSKEWVRDLVSEPRVAIAAQNILEHYPPPHPILG